MINYTTFTNCKTPITFYFSYPKERSLLISTWIDIGQELRLLKNFSSLKAIISGLQSNSVYRLNKTWAALCKEKVNIITDASFYYWVLLISWINMLPGRMVLSEFICHSVLLRAFFRL